MLDEVARTAAERGLTNVVVRQAAAEKLPFESSSFDVVLCRFTAHHWQAMEAGLREARRVIKQPGRAVFVDTIAPADRTLDTHLQAVELLRDPSHVRNYSTAEWVSALSRSGFSLDSITIRTLRMEFPVWIARTRTPKLHAEAIRGLQASSPDVVRAHFAIEAMAASTSKQRRWSCYRRRRLRPSRPSMTPVASLSFQPPALWGRSRAPTR
jgi:SAM-dependent methyltransferase